MGPGRGAGRASCLALNPDNLAASARRRTRLLAAFDGQDVNTRADLLELAETIAFAAGDARMERDDLRDLVRQVYQAAGWDDTLPVARRPRPGEMPETLPAHERDDPALPWRVAWGGGESWRAWHDRGAAERDYAVMAAPEPGPGAAALGGVAVYRRRDGGGWQRTDLYRQG